MLRRGTYWALLLILPGFLFPVMLLAAGDHKHVKHKYWTKKYDRYFKKNTKHYFGPGFDWHWFKAQGIAESGLNPKAKSRAGAVGIMQIMPTTYDEILKRKTHLGKIEEPRWNIAAAIYYNRQLYKRWKKRDISADERLDFTFASYNAGFNRVLRALKKASKKNPQQPEAIKQWDNISPFTPPETRHYIRRIEGLMTVQSEQK